MVWKETAKQCLVKQDLPAQKLLQVARGRPLAEVMDLERRRASLTGMQEEVEIEAEDQAGEDEEGELRDKQAGELHVEDLLMLEDRPGLTMKEPEYDPILELIGMIH